MSFIHNKSTYQASITQRFENTLDHIRVGQLFGSNVQQLDTPVCRDIVQITYNILLLALPLLCRVQEDGLHA